MKRRWLIVITIILATAALVFGLYLKQANPVPKNIRQQINFSFYYPGSSYEVDKDSINFNKDSKVLSYSVAITNSNKAAVNQQATPETFTDLPEYYPQLLDKLKAYSSFETDMGTIHLTRPVELKGGQTAVANHKGTLIFAQPASDLSEDEWRLFFNALEQLTS